MSLGRLPSESMTQRAGDPPVGTRQNAMSRPSGDSLAWKSHVGGTDFVERSDPPVARIEPADFDAASGQVGLVVAVEGIEVWTLGLVFPRNLGSGEPAREENRAGAGPRGHVRPAAPGPGIAVASREPHGLPRRQHAMLGAVGAADADVGPFVPRIRAVQAIDVQDPATVGRPARAEVEMLRPGRDAHAIRPIGIARPDLIAFRARPVKRDPAAVGAEPQAVWKSLERVMNSNRRVVLLFEA
jgi:hypothetical protein